MRFIDSSIYSLYPLLFLQTLIISDTVYPVCSTTFGNLIIMSGLILYKHTQKYKSNQT